jgi:hypothetical protein
MTDKAALATIPKALEDLMTLDRPTGADEGTLGNEGIGRQDILMPRIGLAQKMSPEIDPTSPRCIPNAKFCDLFHSLTKQVLPQPLHFVILRRDDPRWIEFNPLDEGGGIKDMDVHKGDERTKFGPDGEKPIATEFHDYIILALTGFDPANPLDSIVALSLKSSGIKAAKHLNFLISLRGPKLICKGVYSLTTGHETDKKTQGVYATYKFANAGWLKPDSAIEKLAVELFDAWKDRRVVIEREPGADDFDPTTIEAQGKTTEM